MWAAQQCWGWTASLAMDWSQQSLRYPPAEKSNPQCREHCGPEHGPWFTGGLWEPVQHWTTLATPEEFKLHSFWECQGLPDSVKKLLQTKAQRGGSIRQPQRYFGTWSQWNHSATAPVMLQDTWPWLHAQNTDSNSHYQMQGSNLG